MIPLAPVMRYSPDQPRDEAGRWTEGGAHLNADVKTAITNTPGAKLVKDGIEVDLLRFQNPEQAGEPSIRTGVFFLPEHKSPWGRYYRERMVTTGWTPFAQEHKPANYYGGTMRVTGRTTLRNPVVVRAGTGGTGVKIAYDQVEGKGAYEKMRTEVLSAVMGVATIETPRTIRQVAAVMEKYGGDPSMAEEIVRHSKGGNLLPYAIQEHIAAHALRKAGYDSVLSYSKHKGQPRLSEVFDLTQTHYPSSEEMKFKFAKDTDAGMGDHASLGWSRELTPLPRRRTGPERPRDEDTQYGPGFMAKLARVPLTVWKGIWLTPWGGPGPRSPARAPAPAPPPKPGAPVPAGIPGSPDTGQWPWDGGDAVSPSPAFGFHSFVVGPVGPDGERIEDHTRVNPYEAIFLRPWTRVAAAAWHLEEDPNVWPEEDAKQKRRPRMFGEPKTDAEVHRYPQLGADMGFFDEYLNKIAKAGEVIAIDFDGTVTVDEDGTENPQMRILVAGLTAEGAEVVIFSARDADEIREWLDEHGWPALGVTNVKSPDFKVILDDRAVHFDPALLGGDTDGALRDALTGFKAWWEKVEKHLPGQHEQESHGNRGGVAPESRDRPGESANFRPAAPAEFIVARNANVRPRYAGYLSDISEEGLAGHRIVLGEGGKSGFALDPDGDLQNVFGGERGFGHAAIRKAISMGAVTLDCFDGKLVGIYGKFGFRETGRMKWDPAKAPRNWNPADDEPDVVFMALTEKEGEGGGISGNYYGGGEWATAKSDARRAALARRGGGIPRRDAGGEGLGGVARRADPQPGADDGRAERGVGKRGHDPCESIEKEYREEEHPRDDSGKWTEGGGGGARESKPKPPMPQLDRKVSSPISRYEAQHRTHPIEHAVLVSHDGVVMMVKDGHQSGVNFTPEEMGLMRRLSDDEGGTVFTHNHPNAGSFSIDDINFARNVGLAEIRASGDLGAAPRREGDLVDRDTLVIYRMRPGSKGFPKYEEIIAMHKDVDIEVYEDMKGKIATGEVTKAKAGLLHHHEIWTRLAAKYPQHFIYSKETKEVPHAAAA